MDITIEPSIDIESDTLDVQAQAERPATESDNAGHGDTLPAILDEAPAEDTVIAPLPFTFVDGVAVMSSLEISRLTGKRHDNVRADIVKMLVSLGKGTVPEFSGTVPTAGHNGSIRRVRVFNLPYRETMILVSGYDVELRAKIVDRWIEFETVQRTPATSSSFDVATLMASSESRFERLLANSEVRVAKLVGEQRERAAVAEERERLALASLAGDSDLKRENADLRAKLENMVDSDEFARVKAKAAECEPLKRRLNEILPEVVAKRRAEVKRDEPKVAFGAKTYCLRDAANIARKHERPSDIIAEIHQAGWITRNSKYQYQWEATPTAIASEYVIQINPSDNARVTERGLAEIKRWKRV